MSNTDMTIFDLDDFEDERATSVVIRGKWQLDGATTLLEAAEMARDLAVYLEQLDEYGYILEGVIDGDYGVARLS